MMEHVKFWFYYNINPHNPTGTVLNSEVIQPLAAVLEKHHVFAIDDFAYYGLEYEGQSDPIARYNPDRTITLFSCSKNIWDAAPACRFCMWLRRYHA